MTSPEDDGLEEALRRALSDAASELDPGTDGLDKIRARIGRRPSRPWLFSVFFGLVDRIRHWTWRGHWAWQESLPRPGALRERRSRRGNFPGWGIGFRFVTVLAGIAVVASVVLGVQPFRHAILQASDSLKGGGGSPRGSAGTEGNGTQASSGGSPTIAAVASSSGQATQVRTTASGKTAVPHPTTSGGRCVSTVLPVLSSAKPSETSAAPEPSATAPSTAEASSPASSSQATPTQPVYTNANAATCPVAPPTKTTKTPTPAPTPTSSSSSPDPAPSNVAPTLESSPAWTDPAPTPTPTPSGSSPTSDPPSSRPSDPPSWSWQGRQERRYADFLDRHHRRR